MTPPPPSKGAFTPATDLSALKPAATRKLYFSETHQDPNNYASPATYFITVDGQKPKAFDMNFSHPNLTVRQGTVEDWTIENRAPEAHAFHIHQLHFQVLERDGKAVHEPSLRDTIDLPYWDGKSALPQRQTADGFPERRNYRHVPLSLPHSGTRGRRHDGHHSRDKTMNLKLQR